MFDNCSHINLEWYVGKCSRQIKCFDRVPIVQVLFYKNCHFHGNCKGKKFESHYCQRKSFIDKRRIISKRSNLQVRIVGIIAVNIIKSTVKNKHPALLMALFASLPMS